MDNHDSEPESWGNVKCILQTGLGCVGMMREGPSVNGKLKTIIRKKADHCTNEESEQLGYI